MKEQAINVREKLLQLATSDNIQTAAQAKKRLHET
jgi:hypothetical protein